MKWIGTICRVGEVSLLPIAGAGDRKAIVSTRAADDIYRNIVGCWIANRHEDAYDHVKFGTIDRVELDGNRIVVGGRMEFLPGSVFAERNHDKYGMSFEALECLGTVNSDNIVIINSIKKLVGASVQMNASFRSHFLWQF